MDQQLEGKLYRAAGVAPGLFRAAFLESFMAASHQQQWDEAKASKVAKGLIASLNRRRGFLLPPSCSPETFHLEKDRWTFIIWIGHLITQDSGSNIRWDDLVSGEVESWVKAGEGCVEAMSSLSQAENSHSEIQKILRGILGLTPNIQENLSKVVKAKPPKKDGIKTVHPTSDRLRYGQEFISFLAKNIGDLPKWAWLNGPYLDVATPGAFNRYAEVNGLDRDDVQRGVQKLRMHVRAPNGGPIVCSEKGNVMRFKIKDLEELS